VAHALAYHAADLAMQTMGSNKAIEMLQDIIGRYTRGRHPLASSQSRTRARDPSTA